MIYTWEASDIAGGVVVVTHNDTETAILGYDYHEDGKGWAITSLKDGLCFTSDLSAVGMANFLNESGYKPVTRGVMAHDLVNEAVPVHQRGPHRATKP